MKISDFKMYIIIIEVLHGARSFNYILLVLLIIMRGLMTRNQVVYVTSKVALAPAKDHFLLNSRDGVRFWFTW